MYKQEALDSLECFRSNTAHILGDNDEKVKTIETCMMLVDEVEEQPEIVRCKDCKYSSPNKVYGCRFERFDTWEYGPRMYSDDFCSRAERRTDE